MTSIAANMLVAADPLAAGAPAERVNYATGVLLQAQDFRDEQTYHRSRLAAALVHLVGHGTLAGLAARSPALGDNDRELRVEPGLAVDRYGRLIELDEPWCIRLALWFAAQDSGSLSAAVQNAPRTPLASAVVADLFLSLADCGRGKTPSFADGPFDALDAVVPSRLAERPTFDLVLRAEDAPAPIPAPLNSWPAADADADTRLAAVLGSYRPGRGTGLGGGLAPFEEHVAGRDASAVLIARIAIPVTQASATATPVLDLSQRVHVDNRVRPFIYLPGKWLGAAPATVPVVEP